MVSQQEEDTEQHHQEENVRIAEIVEKQKTVRHWGTLAAFLGAIYMIQNAIVEIMGAPVWWVIVAAIIVSPLSPALVAAIIERRFRRYTQRDRERLVRWELEQDEDRDSSGLEIDGSTPEGDEIWPRN